MSDTPFGFCLPSNVSAEVFLTQYWQKKPLLMRGALPTLSGLLTPDDLLELATFDEVTARLITQDNDNPNQWQLEFGPFERANFDKLPKLHTVLVQDLEQWSLEVAEHWQAFDFLPQWLRDDIMVSYAPTGGSVGKHYDRYDVFLVQGFGQRRWQLGKFCNEKTAILPDQPLRLIDDMGDIIFDEVLNSGDVLYVPPFLSHYGVAQNDCLTFSFGFRSPTNLQLLDALVAQVSESDFWQAPCTETLHKPSQQAATSTELDMARLDMAEFYSTTTTTQQQVAQRVQQETQQKRSLDTHSGSISHTQLSSLKNQLIDSIKQMDDAALNQVVAKSLSQRRFNLLQEDDVMETDILLEALVDGAVILKEPAVKLLYTLNGKKKDDPLDFFCQGEHLEALYPTQKWLLKKLADGDRLGLEDLEGFDIDALCDWTNNGWVTIKH